MKFNLVSGLTAKGDVPEVATMLESACQSLGVTFVSYNAEELNYFDLQALGPNDMLYRCRIGSKPRLAEKMLISETCAHFYDDWKTAFNIRGGSYFLHKKIGIPVIPTLPFIPKDEEGVTRAVTELGGLPLIVKVVGGTNGVGVLRADSLGSLKSILDYFRKNNTSVLLRKYVAHEYYARLVVIGDSVIASKITYAPVDDFRTNAGSTERKSEPKKFSNTIEEMAVRAVRSLGYETGGVDLLIDGHGSAHLAEVNVPNDFADTQNQTGVDIARLMVEYLMKKIST